ncbi:AbiH family protein [Lacticaseibacillus paracasei]|uniref:AbiH family protein n=1 Tax=Lacticaseibacillus paracasei TaxID=1597 RepID=UPI0013EAEF1C|nr:AbiH family protein [Lacticaseibacillus paracasei]
MNQPIGAPERLAIIGNGFDLKCGLHSTFGEYIKQILKTQDPNGFFLNAYHEMLTNQEFSEDARKLLTNEGIKPTNTSANDMGLLPSTDLDNFWVTVLLLKHEEGNDWADIEAAIGQFLKSPVVTHLLSWSSNRHAVPPVKNDEDKQAIVLISFLSNCLEPV